MLDADTMFQSLLFDLAPTGAGVAAELDVGSFDALPYIVHSSQVQQDRNHEGLYTVTLSASLFLDHAETSFSFVSDMYDGIYSWVQSPTAGIVAGVGAIESMDQELSAFNRLTSGVQMMNKVVTQYVGSWEFTVRELA